MDKSKHFYFKVNIEFSKEVHENAKIMGVNVTLQEIEDIIERKAFSQFYHEGDIYMYINPYNLEFIEGGFKQLKYDYPWIEKLDIDVCLDPKNHEYLLMLAMEEDDDFYNAEPDLYYDSDEDEWYGFDESLD